MLVKWTEGETIAERDKTVHSGQPNKKSNKKKCERERERERTKSKKRKKNKP